MWSEDDEYNENDNYDPTLEEEDVNYEAAKDLEASRWQGVVSACRR